MRIRKAMDFGVTDWRTFAIIDIAKAMHCKLPTTPSARLTCLVTLSSHASRSKGSPCPGESPNEGQTL